MSAHLYLHRLNIYTATEEHYDIVQRTMCVDGGDLDLNPLFSYKVTKSIVWTLTNHLDILGSIPLAASKQGVLLWRIGLATE